MKELVQTSSESQINKLATMEVEKAFGIAEKFFSRINIPKEFGYSSNESVLLIAYFTQYCIYQTRNNQSDSLPDLEAKRIVSTVFERIIQEETEIVETETKEKGKSGKIQGLAIALSDSFLQNSCDLEKIKEAIDNAKTSP